MTIDEAIKNLTPLLDPETTPLTYSETEATKLGIEALKVVEEYHSYLEREGVAPLPGETR